MHKGDCWGWATWSDRWVLNLLKKDLWTVYPSSSYVTNSGFDGSGTHSNKSDDEHYFAPLTQKHGNIEFTNKMPDELLEKQAATYPRKGLKAGIKYHLKRCYVLMYDIVRIVLIKRHI